MMVHQEMNEFDSWNRASTAHNSGDEKRQSPHPTPTMNTSTIKPKVTRYRVNAAFTQAVLFFADGSYLQFEHASRKDRWAKASSDDGTAEDVCQALRSFRLNSKHLQLHFADGSDIDFSHITEQEEE